MSEVKSAIKEINKFHKKIILHCVSDYPTALKTLNYIKSRAKKTFKNYLIGISDHTNGNTSLNRIYLGIVAIEKHFKLNPKEKTITQIFN